MNKLIFTLALLLTVLFVSAENISDLKQKLETTEGLDRVEAYTNLLRAFIAEDDIPQAIAYGRKGEAFLETIKVEHKIKGVFLWAFAAAYNEDKNYGKAVKYYLKAQLFLVGSGSQEMTMVVYYEMATAYRMMDQYEEASEHYKNGIHISTHIKDYQMSSKIYTALSEMYGKLKRYRDAFEYFKKVNEIQRRKEKQEEKQRIKFLTIKAELARVEKENKELELINKDFELNKERKTKNKLKHQVKRKNATISNLNETSKLQSDSIKEKEKEVVEKTKQVDFERERVKMREDLIMVIFGAALITFLLFLLSVRLYFLTRKKNRLLQSQNITILGQKREIEQKNEELTLTLAEVQGLTDMLIAKNTAIDSSIRYAKRIQTAILPSDTEAEEVLKRHFTLWMPRDTVSGDYYWFADIGDKTVVIAADCTGHGVPGAFMSALGVAFLNEIVKQRKVTAPNEILDQMRDGVIGALAQTKTSHTKDGMDMSCAVIDRKAKIVNYSGANNPLYLLRTGEITTYKGDPMPVAIHPKMRPFKVQSFEYKPGDSLYLFSDGFLDQFGGDHDTKYGSKRFKAFLLTIRHKSMFEQKDKLIEELARWKGTKSQLDDILVMGVKL